MGLLETEFLFAGCLNDISATQFTPALNNRSLAELQSPETPTPKP